MNNNDNKNDKKQSKYMAYGMCFWHDCGQRGYEYLGDVWTICVGVVQPLELDL